MKMSNKIHRIIATAIATVSLGATIAAIPANAVTAGVPNAAGRYVMPGVVTQKNELTIRNELGNYEDFMCVFIEDMTGNVWCYVYDPQDEIPPMYQRVILIMNTNGTPDEQDDIIEDVLWSDTNEID